jgi:hypothetical protein
MGEFFYRALGFYEGAQKILAPPDYSVSRVPRRPHRDDIRFGRCSVYIYAFLKGNRDPGSVDARRQADMSRQARVAAAKNENRP